MSAGPRYEASSQQRVPWNTEDYVRVTREELYELVWSTSMLKLSKRYGLSRVQVWYRCATGDGIEQAQHPELAELSSRCPVEVHDRGSGRVALAGANSAPPTAAGRTTAAPARTLRT